MLENRNRAVADARRLVGRRLASGTPSMGFSILCLSRSTSNQQAS